MEAINLRQKDQLFAKLESAFDGDLAGKTITLWGLALIWLEGVIEGDSQLASQTLRQLLTEDSARDAIGSRDLSAALE